MRDARGHLSAFGPGADHALDQRAGAARAADERLADLQRPSGALSRRQKSNFDDPILAMQPMTAWRQGRTASPRCSAGSSTPPACSGSPATRTSGYERPRLPLVGDAARLSRPATGAALALLLRLAVRHQRPGLSAVEPRAAGISAATSRRPAKRRSSISAPRSPSMRRLKFPKGDEAKRYNVLQKLSLSRRASSCCCR